MTDNKECALLDLAAKVEALTGPCRETDWAIVILMGWIRTKMRFEVPAYTESLDAAMTLIPSVATSNGYTTCEEDGLYQAHCYVRPLNIFRFAFNCKTPALALTAAALHALAALESVR